MSKPVVVKQGVETLFTYLACDKANRPTGALVAVLADGTRWGRTLSSGKWVLIGQRKADVPMEQWLQSRRERFESLPTWARNVKSLPTLRTLMRWSNDGVAMTVDGQRIEPDGVASNGAPSWLLVVGVI
jgi:hypothetical protein